jgi:predicted nucleic acid-binding protein
MVLVDTSVWIDFLRQGNKLLEELLLEGEVATHPLIIGELHVGNIKDRTTFLSLLANLPQIEECSHDEVLFLVDEHELYGKGIGYTDAHLLCSSVMHEAPLWTLDKRLDKMAKLLSSL